ncbi:hypothetical protein BDV12DRAFT_203595 [Aspergillus spectabilis]
MPLEVLFAILDAFDSDTTSLSRLSRSCHYLHSIVPEFLYRRLVLGNSQTRPFRDTLKSNPGLAKFVKSLSVHHHYVEPENVADFRPLIAEALAPTIGKLTQLEILKLKGCGMDTPFADVGSHWRHRRLYDAAYGKFHKLFLKAMDGSVLSNLKTLTLNLSDRKLWMCEMELFMFHPTLKKLSILGAAICPFVFLGPQRSTCLEELELLCCDISSETLGRALSVPKALRRLVFKGATRTLPTMPHYVEVERQPYVEAIAQQAHSLKVLDIDFWLDLDVSHEPIDLSAISQVETLTTRPRVLDGVTYEQTGDEVQELPLKENYLPRTLTHFTLCDVDEAIPTGIQNMLLDVLNKWRANDSLPNLASITFENAQSFNGSGDMAVDSPIPVVLRELSDGGRFAFNCRCSEYQLSGSFPPQAGGQTVMDV